MGVLTQGIWFGARAGVFGYAAHLLNREGVFSHTADPDVTIQALVAKTPPMLTDSVDQYVRPYIPSSLRIPEYTPPRDLWNWMVLEGGNLLADIPDNCSAAGSYVLDTAKQFVQ